MSQEPTQDPRPETKQDTNLAALTNKLNVSRQDAQVRNQQANVPAGYVVDNEGNQVKLREPSQSGIKTREK